MGHAPAPENLVARFAPSVAAGEVGPLAFAAGEDRDILIGGRGADVFWAAAVDLIRSDGDDTIN